MNCIQEHYSIKQGERVDHTENSQSEQFEQQSALKESREQDPITSQTNRQV